MQRRDDRADARVLFGILLREARSDRLHLRAGFLQRHTELHPSDDFKEMIAALRCFFGIKSQRNPDLIAPLSERRQLNATWQDADHGVALAVQGKRAADDTWI